MIFFVPGYFARASKLEVALSLSLARAIAVIHRASQGTKLQWGGPMSR